MKKDLWFNQSGGGLSVSSGYSSNSTFNSQVFNPDADADAQWSVGNPDSANINQYVPNSDNINEEPVEDNTDGEDSPELPLGDTIDKFDPSGNIWYSHPFDERGIPDEIKVNIRNAHCKFVKLQLEKLYNDLNFANSQAEIDTIYSSIDKMEEIQNECY
jgi:hypothetical protein|tara:strand:- start:7238 stop:7714 length:477 start_codon:yes stop_codon:yes gene_type:complete